MFKLLLVDDKKDIVDGIEAAVDWHSKEVQTFGFYNGKDALEQIKEEPPDMVITDINMPYMSGLELAKAVAEINPEIRFIVLTGYDEFSYAREALHLGVVEYLSKPVRIEVIEALVMKEKDRLQQEKKKQQDFTDIRVKFNQSLPFIKSRWFQNFVHEKKKTSAAMLGELFGEMEIPLRNHGFNVVLIERDHSNQSDQKLLMYAIENIAKELVGKFAPCEAFQYHENRLALLVNYDSETNMIVNHYELYSQLVEVGKCFREYFGTTISIGIGMCYEEAEGIYHSFEEAQEALAHKLYFGNNSIISIQDLAKGNVQNQITYPTEREERIIRLIKQADYPQAKQEVNAYFAVMRQMKSALPANIREKMVSFLLQLRSECLVEPALNIIELLDEFRQLKTLIEVEAWFLNYIKYLCENQDVENTGIKQDMIKVKEYIDRHYQESITLKKMADYIYISQSYLSFTFKEIMKINFNEYLTRVRMERAKELLATNRYKIYEVCELVGYSDKKHFGELFKKYTGVLPKEWSRKDG